MIETLEITNFKSVKHLSLPCKRFNLFIGEPNTGKSNILEALGLVSFVGVRDLGLDVDLVSFVRHEHTSNLFFDDDIDNHLFVRCDDAVVELGYDRGLFRGSYDDGQGNIVEITGGSGTVGHVDYFSRARIVPVRFYRFSTQTEFGEFIPMFLLPPDGNNLPALLVHDKELRDAVRLPILARGLSLGLRPRKNEIELIKSFEDDVLVSYPFSLASDTLKRITFYTAALMTNHDSVLVFEEPEAHSFPHYTNHLAERIALDENNNQYFIATHNPYFLMPLLEKVEKGQLAINIVYSEDHQTRVMEIPPSDLPELFELDVFANLDRYLET